MLFFSLYGVLAVLMSPLGGCSIPGNLRGEFTGSLEMERCQELEIGD
jgi:hypothetical protein